MNSDSQADADMEVLRKHVNQIGEHFDTVQIFCTRTRTDGSQDTEGFQIGSGSWYARYGQVREWMVRADQHARNKADKDEEEDEEEDED